MEAALLIRPVSGLMRTLSYQIRATFRGSFNLNYLLKTLLLIKSIYNSSSKSIYNLEIIYHV